MTARIPCMFAAVLLVSVVAGCTTGSGGDGDPRPPSPFPPQPAGIDVQALQPCDLLTAAQVEELGLRTSTPGTVNVDGLPSSGCTWIGSSMVNYNAQFIPADAAVATRLPGAVVTQVNGFGAVRNTPESKSAGGPICQLAIDAAPGQTIRVQALTTSAQAAPPIDEICRRASDVASKVMTTAVATAGR